MAADPKQVEMHKKYMAIINDPNAPQSRKDMAQDKLNELEYQSYEASKGKKCGGSIKGMKEGGVVAGKGYGLARGAKKCKVV